MCFSLGAIESFLIWLVVVCLIIGFLKILVPWILTLANVALSDPIMRIIGMVITAVVVIAVIMVVFWLLGCLLGAGGVGYRLR